MKKPTPKLQKPPKLKLQLKPKTKPNYFPSSRTSSPHSPRGQYYRTDKFTQQARNRQETGPSRSGKQHKRGQYRTLNYDTQKIIRKKYQQDETGTQTPMVPMIKKMPLNSQPVKKKSSHSLTVGDKPKKKTTLKTSSKSGQLTKTTMQRLLSVIIKDYKQGKLTQKDLENTLIQLYDRKDKARGGKKNKKKQLFNGFSNQYLRVSQQTKSQALMRRRKKSDQIQQRVLERKGFVNKIIIKGITTSLFLKEQTDLAVFKQESKMKNPEIGYRIDTSHSVVEMNQEIRNMQERYDRGKGSEVNSIEERMAIRIQRAWRRYRTNKILNLITKKNQPAPNLIFQDIDSFTDQDNQMPSPQMLKRSSAPQNFTSPQLIFQQSNNYAQLVRIIAQNFQSKTVTKQQCLKNIMKCLKLPQELVSIPEHQQDDRRQQQQEKQGPTYEFQQQQDDKDSNIQQDTSLIRLNRVRVQPQDQYHQNLQAIPSNDLNSFTNKYSSKQIKEPFEPIQELDQSLTFAQVNHAAQSFKTINIGNIQQGLRSRQTALQLHKARQLQQLTQKYLNNKISKEEYKNEKGKLDKWFKHQLKELRVVKNTLMKSCSQAQKMLQKGLVGANKEKNRKMMKCLSDKYIRKNWNLPAIGQQQLESVNSREVIIEGPGSKQIFKKNNWKTIKTITQQQNDQKQSQLQKQIQQQKQKSSQLNKNIRELQISSPKLPRREELQQQDGISDYRYQQIQQNIEQDQCLVVQQQLRDSRIIAPQLQVQTRNQQNSLQQHELSLIQSLLNEAKKKLKYLCTQDKQDIFQFLFLDLILEPFTQGYIGQARILRSAQIYINKQKRLKKITKGIKTSLPACKDYLKTVNNFIVKDRKNLINLSAAMGPSAGQMLKYMRDQLVQMEQDAVASTLVMPLQLFEQIRRLPQLALKLQKYYQDDQQRQQSRVSFLKTALHIHQKALFDCLNQMLDHQRPYGIWGKPFPWKKQLGIDRKWSQNQQKMKLGKAIQRTVQSCSYLCGIIVDKQQSLFGSHRVSQDYIFQLRQDRLSKMLANDLIENEDRWIFYSDEETEVLMEVSAFLMKKMVKEAVIELSMLGLKR